MLPFGAPVDGPPCILQRPLAIPADWQGLPARVRRRSADSGTWAIGFAWGCSSKQLRSPTPVEVTRYVVLDDEDDCLDELPLFQPTSRTGLTLDISKGIEEFLAGRSDKDMRANTLTRLGQNIHALFHRDKS